MYGCENFNEVLKELHYYPSCNDCVVTDMFGGIIVSCCVLLIVTKDI